MMLIVIYMIIILTGFRSGFGLGFGLRFGFGFLQNRGALGGYHGHHAAAQELVVLFPWRPLRSETHK